MSQHHPNINWNTGEIQQWSESCFQTCLSSVQRSTIPHFQPSSKQKSTTLSINSTTIESPEVEHKGEIPLEYRAFHDVFSKRLATQLPPHRPWDCAIDLLPGATPPKGKVLPTVHPGAEGHGGVHSGGTSTTLHSTFHIPCRFKLLLRC